jgi:hypothetical protein
LKLSIRHREPDAAQLVVAFGEAGVDSPMAKYLIGIDCYDKREER